MRLINLNSLNVVVAHGTMAFVDAIMEKLYVVTAHIARHVVAKLRHTM